MTGGVAVRRGVERHDREPGADERLDEPAELRSAAFPAVHQQRGGTVAPAPGGHPPVLAAPAGRAQRDVDREAMAGRQHLALALGAGVAPR